MTQPATARLLRVGAFALAFALALQGCREDEQDRVIFYEKGTYAGKPDHKLTDAQVDRLRQRAAGHQL